MSDSRSSLAFAWCCLFSACVLSPPCHSAVGAVNVNARGDEEHVLTEENRNLELAKTDVTMKRHLMLDLLLYEQAVAIHRIQLDQYGLA